MKHARLFTAVIALTLFIALLILTDGLPLLRGPQPDSEMWHWMYGLRPLGRWWMAGLAGALFMSVSVYWLLNPRSLPTGLVLGGLCFATLFLQLSFVYADRGQAYTELIDRALAVQTNGYFWTAASIDNISETVRQYPSLMPTFESDHVRTHPPGLLIANWQAIRLAASQPTLATQLAAPVWQRRCTDLWLLNQPPHVVAALGLWAILPALLAATAVFPAYLIGQQLNDPQSARLGTLLTVLIPSLLIFTPTPDQISAVLTLWTLFLLIKGLKSNQVWFTFLAGLLLSIMSFISLGNAVLSLALGGLIFLFSLSKNKVQRRNTVDTKKDRRFRKSAQLRLNAFAINHLAMAAIGSVTIWLIYWLGWGVPPWQIAQAGLAEHEALVLVNRSYGTWTLFNGIDLLSFLGLPILAGFMAFLFSENAIGNSIGKPLAWSTAVLLLLLNFSGSTRGEVGRIWLFLFPILALCAGLYFGQRFSPQQNVWLISTQLGLVIAVALAWQPIEATIVVTERPASPQIEMAMPLAAQFEQGITLQGYTAVQNETAVQLTLFWQSDGDIFRPYTVFNHLLDENNEIVSQTDGWSMQGQWPTSCWQAGETIVDTFELPLPAETDRSYQIAIGLYDARDSSRVPLVGGETAVFLPSALSIPDN